MIFHGLRTRGIGIALQLCMLCATLAIVAAYSARIAAQTTRTPGLEAMRIFVDEKDIDRVVTPAFLMVPMDELDKLLKDYVERRSLSTVQQSGIERATYVARWNEQMLVSRASQFQVTAATAGTTVDMRRLSLAIEEPQGAPESSVPLTRQLHYVDDNHLQLQCEPNQLEYWFGFKAKTRRRDSGQHAVELQLPQAAVALMLIAVPTHTVVTSNLPCGTIADINKVLPEGWPSVAVPAITADEQWYAVWMSGQQTCSLNFSPATKVKGSSYRMLVPSAQSDTQITPAGIQVSSQFRLTAPPPEGKLRLLVEDQLHVRSISVGAVEVNDWKAIRDELPMESDNASVRARARLIEVPCDAPDSGPLVLTVDCIGRVPLPLDGPLPRVEIEGAYVLDGRCTLLGNDRMQVEDARSTAHVLATTSQNGLAQWQWQWTGKAPATSVRLRVAPPQWTVRALTRLDVQSDVVVASVNAHLTSSHVSGNQATLKLAAGWFVDSVELENAPIGVTASINDTAGDASELSIRWDERRSDLDVRVLVEAHYHQSTEVENLRLTSTRILSLPGADQTDTYILKSSGRFRLELDPELLRLRVREDDLVPWQRALLPRLADAWIFNPGHAALPAIKLSRTRATLVAELNTTVKEEFNQVSVHYSALCKPISGSIKQLKVQMSLPTSAVAPTWSIAAPFTGNDQSKITATSSAISSSNGETTFTIDLSEDMSEEFQIEAELNLPRIDSQTGRTVEFVSVPLPRVRQVVSQEAVLVIPSSYRLPDNVPSLEILPPGLCCDGGRLVESSKNPDVVAMRYDANAFAKLDLQPPLENSHNGWARSQLHEHWQYRAGRTLHYSTWELATTAEQKLEIKLPRHWEFHSLTINDQLQDVRAGQYLTTPSATTSTSTSAATLPTATSNTSARKDETFARQSESQLLEFEVPKGTHVRVSLTCSSAENHAWYAPVVFDRPEISWSVLESRAAVWLPKSRWATQGWPKLAGTWQQRFCPQQWWHLLSFHPGLIPQDSADGVNENARVGEQSADILPELEQASERSIPSYGWWKLEFDDRATAPSLWVLDQSLAGAISLSLFLFSCILITLVCGAAWWRWWTCWIVTGTALAIIPAQLLFIVQLIALGLIASSLARLARATVYRSRAASVKRYDSLHLSKSLLPKSSVMSAWLFAICFVGLPSAWAQPFKSGIKDKREVFGILIPVDDKYKVAGEYVYISPRLYGLLRNSDRNETQTSEVRIASAIYSLGISNDLINANNTVGDVTVELSIQATRADAELRLPFLRSEVTLVRAVQDAQSLIIGDRIRQEGDGIVWRSADGERHSMRLTLRPRMVTQREGRGQLSISIPAIPTARCEIQSETLSDLRDIVVDSIGGTQTETFRTMAVRLGPLNRLNVSWPLSPNRSGPTQVQSDTWVHSRGDKIMAMCQLRMRGASGLAGTLAVAGDSNWIPVGQDWEDFRMVTTEGSSTLGRPIYNVEKIEDRLRDELTLKVLMLPRDETAASQSIPFLSIQQPQPIVSVSRTLALSHTDTPQWKTVGTDWQPLLASQASQLWNGTRLADQPSLWKVPAGTVQATLQRVSLPSAPAVDEVTEVQLQMPETKIKYVARWSSPLIGPSAVRFQIPNGMRLENVMVDAIKARHSIHRLPGSSTTSELVVFIDSSLGGIQSLHLQFNVPTRLNKAFRLPRPLLMDAEVRTSLFQVFRGVELTSTHTMGDSSDLQFQNLEARDSLLLQDLQTPVGRLDLGNGWREAAELPMEFTLARAPAARNGRALLRLSRSDKGWRGHLDAIVDIKSDELNHVFFDMPRTLESSMKDPVESNVAMTAWQSPDSNRILLSVMPTRDSADQAHISFSFRLPSSGVSQTINIPDIRLLGVTAPRPALALPKELSGEAVRWTGIGRPLQTGWLQALTETVADLSSFDLFEPIDNQSQAVWHSSDQREKAAQLLLTSIELSGRDYDRSSAARATSESTLAASLQGEICYWVDPHERPYLDIDMPKSCELVGLETNDQPAHWQQTSATKARVLMQPSYLPSRIRLLVRWSGLDDQLSSTATVLQLPRPNAVVSGPVLMCQRSEGSVSQNKRPGHWQVADAQPLSVEQVETIQAQSWADMLTRSAPIAAGRGSNELVAWLPGWEPMWLGLGSASSVTITQPSTNRTGTTSDGAREQLQVTVADFWLDFLKQQTDPAILPARVQQDLASQWSLDKVQSIRDFQWQQLSINQGDNLDKIALLGTASGRESDWFIRWLIAFGWLVCAVGVGAFSSGSLRGFFVALGELIWPLWLALATASALLLPVLWPAAVVSGGLGIVLVRRYRQLRRDRQFVLTPKQIR